MATSEAKGRDRKSNTRLATVMGLVALGMVGVAFASVPAYRLFCQVTGYGGTPSVSAEGAAGSTVIDREMKVRFDASVNGTMPWHFAPVQREVTVKVGEQGLAYFQATNPTDQPITGTATFNVTPNKAAQYFVKVDCFCFTEQTLEPGQTVDMPVTFYVDPTIVEDENVKEVKTITLSYTFFRKAGGSGQGKGNS